MFASSLSALSLSPPLAIPLAILAQGGGGLRNLDWSIGGIAIGIVVIAAVVALVYIYLRHAGVAMPAWLMQVFWVVVAAIVVIAAIKIVLSMW